MNHSTELEAFFTDPQCEALPAASEGGKIDQIITLLERLVAAAESKSQGRGSRGAYDLPQAKKWIVESLEELGPQTRGSLNTRMLQSRRCFLDPALSELVTENTLCVVEPELGRKGPRNPRYATPDQAQFIAERQAELEQRIESERLRQVEAERHAAAAARFSSAALGRYGLRAENRIAEAGGSASREAIVAQASNETERDLFDTSIDEFIRLGRIEERDGQLSVSLSF